MDRITARNEQGFAYLVNVKPDEQEVDSPYKNTLRCILDCFEQCAQYEDAGLTPEEVTALKDELARVTAERDKAVEQIEQQMIFDAQNGREPCEICANAEKTPCIHCEPKWRGAKEQTNGTP